MQWLQEGPSFLNLLQACLHPDWRSVWGQYGLSILHPETEDSEPAVPCQERISCSACQDAPTHLRTDGGREQGLEAQHGVCGQETEPSWPHCSPGAHQRSNGTCSLCSEV